MDSPEAKAKIYEARAAQMLALAAMEDDPKIKLSLLEIAECYAAMGIKALEPKFTGR